MKRQWDTHKTSSQKIRERQVLDDDVWHDYLLFVETNTRLSCYDAFIKEPFYKELPPNLQDKLVKVCLKKLCVHFDQFFRDMNT